jgi:hypothetical protein
MTLYERGTWTCPASHNTSEKKWDLSFLSKQEFIEKYKITSEQYEDLLLNGAE